MAETEQQEEATTPEQPPTATGDASVLVETLDLTEHAPVSPEEWERRMHNAERAMTDWHARFLANGWEIEKPGQIYGDSLKVFLQCLVSEGRTTWAEIQARTREVQLRYVEAQYESKWNSDPHAIERASGRMPNDAKKGRTLELLRTPNAKPVKAPVSRRARAAASHLARVK